MSTSQDIDAVTPILCDHLEEQTEDGTYYFKGRKIADDLDSTSKQIGAVMVQIEDTYPEGRDVSLSIERWSYTGATTWKVDRQ